MMGPIPSMVHLDKIDFERILHAYQLQEVQITGYALQFRKLLGRQTKLVVWMSKGCLKEMQ